MKRHLKAPVPTLHLSMEEDAIAIDEQNALLQEIRQDHQDVARLTDTNAIVADAVSVIETVEQPVTPDHQLLGAVADMAVAGSDADPTELVPPVSEGKDISTESFISSVKEKVLKIWEAIKSAISRMWERIKQFFQNILAYFSGSAKRVKELRELLDKHKKGIDALEGARSYWNKKQWLKDMEEMAKYSNKDSGRFNKGYLPTSTVTDGDTRTGVQFLTIDGKIPSDFNDAVDTLYETAWRVAKHLPETATIIEKDINHSLDQIVQRPEEKDKILSQFCNRSQIEFKKLASQLGLSEKEGEKSAQRYTPHMLGNVVLQGTLNFGHSNNLEENLDDLTQAELRTAVLAFKSTEQLPKEIPHLKSVGDVEKLLVTIEYWLNQSLPEINKEINAAHNSHYQFFTKTNGSFNKISDEMSSEVVHSIKSLVYVSSRLTGMIGRSVPEYLQHAHKVTTVVLDYAIHSFVKILLEEEQKDGGKKDASTGIKTVLSANWQMFIKEGDIQTIRQSLLVDLKNKKYGAADLQAIAKEVERQVPNLWEPYEVKSFAKAIDENKQNWSEEYYNHQLVYIDTNFSKKRWDHIVQVRSFVKK